MSRRKEFSEAAFKGMKLGVLFFTFFIVIIAAIDPLPLGIIFLAPHVAVGLLLSVITISGIIAVLFFHFFGKHRKK